MNATTIKDNQSEFYAFNYLYNFQLNKLYKQRNAINSIA